MIPEKERMSQSLTPARKKRLLRHSFGMSQMFFCKQNIWRIEMEKIQLNRKSNRDQ